LIHRMSTIKRGRLLDDLINDALNGEISCRLPAISMLTTLISLDRKMEIGEIQGHFGKHSFVRQFSDNLGSLINAELDSADLESGEPEPKVV
jgi:hypothetical protein